MHAARETSQGPLKIKVSQFGSTQTLELAGELDLATVPVLQENLEAAQKDGAEVVVVDMSGLEFIDSTGIALLIESDRRFSEDGGRFLLIRSEAPAVARVLALTELDRRLHFVDRPPAG